MVLFWLNAEWDEVPEDIRKRGFRKNEKSFLMKYRNSRMPKSAIKRITLIGAV